MTKSVYFDNNSTSPVDPEVLQVMLPYFSERFGNPSSQHAWGWTAEEAAQKARTQIASLVHCHSKEIYFTASATESNNLAIKGVFESLIGHEKSHFICSDLDHSSILACGEYLKTKGVEVDFVRSNKFGQVDLDHLKTLIKPYTKLMSFVWVNNVIGTINPISEISDLAHKNKIYLHVDATQATGKVKIDLQKVSVDLMTFSAHKMNGPKGIAALFVKSKNPHVELQPILHGGQHERGLRASSLNVPSIVGFGHTCEMVEKNLEADLEKFKTLHDQLLLKLQTIFSIQVLGHPTERAFNNVCVLFKGVEIPLQMPFLAFSRGSACQAQDVWTPNPLLLKLGYSAQEAKNTIRFTFGRQNSVSEIDSACEYLQKSLNRNKIDS